MKKVTLWMLKVGLILLTPLINHFLLSGMRVISKPSIEVLDQLEKNMIQ